MTPQEFVAKWQAVNLSERSACQQHFLDLCDLLGQPKPAAADPDGAWYTFERGVRKSTGEHGWADVWMRGHFGWEYKCKHKDLNAAYVQLLLYRDALESPPLLIVCDLDRFEIHTNFTGTASETHAFGLADLAEPANLDILRKVFTDPQSLCPKTTTISITEEAANRFAELADGMRLRGVPAHPAAHFLMRLMFCMFGEDIRLLPPGLFARLLDTSRNDPERLTRKLQTLFEAMAGGGDFGSDEILRFNGGLFADAQAITLTREEIKILIAVNTSDWSSVEPSIFGTLFERTLDPAKRSQIGAHYTSRDDIVTLLEPVLMAPLRREWEAVKKKCEEKLWPAVEKVARTRSVKHGVRTPASKERKAYNRALQSFAERLTEVTVLDPACGSGNFLYVAINLLLDLEKEVIAYAASHGLNLLPHVRPTQLLGLEINPYAQELAQVVIWIGYLQWMYHNGFKAPSDPVLEPIETIRCMDSIIDLSDPSHPIEPEWPEADFIVGNPPFLGGGMLRSQLGDDYVEKLFALYADRIPNFSDLCCYWFEKSSAQIKAGKCKRAGLLATQGIRGGASREVLKRIKANGDIFFAQSDRDWVLDGANVHVSMVGFDDGSETQRVLDGNPAATINANLTATADTTAARTLKDNLGVCFMGPSPKAPFDITDDMARSMLNQGGNVHGRPDSDVIRRVQSGVDLTKGDRGIWTIDFGLTSIELAAKYQLAFEHLKAKVFPIRSQNRRKAYAEKWWQYAEARPGMRKALAETQRCIATPEVAKHRIFVWRTPEFLCNQQTLVFARDDDYFFGVLHCRVHELWARAQGTQLREVESGFRYTPTTCFETFPFPEPTADQEAAIAEAARELDELRSRWLNPPEWTKTEVLEFPGSADGPWARYVHDADARGIGTVRWPRVVPKDPDCAASLKSRTLTNLYNQRPTWLDQAHRKLDAAVLAAYGWETSLSDDALLEKLLALNLARAKAQ